MGWRYGDWSRILIHGINSSTLCSEQTLSAFHYIVSVPAYSRFGDFSPRKELTTVKTLSNPSNSFVITMFSITSPPVAMTHFHFAMAMGGPPVG